jgi:pyruvate, orthophosphate dikinase
MSNVNCDMTPIFGNWTIGLDGVALPSRDLIGGKAWSVARMQALGLNVPSAFVVTTEACKAYLASGELPSGLDEEIGAAIDWLELRAGRSFGKGPHPLLVSVRSGAPVSMPGMMDTVLNLGINDATEIALAAECENPAFARNTHKRFLELYAHIVLRATIADLDGASEPPEWRSLIAASSGSAVPTDPREQLRSAVRSVFESWNSRRARRYRQHHNIPDDLGTAVTVQVMVFGNLDARSGTGVLFSRNPSTGAAVPHGEYLPCAQGEDVVSGKFTPKPLSVLAAEQPKAHEELLAAARSLELAGGDVQDIEFTVERGKLFFLQSRAAKLAPHAAAQIAVDLVREGVIDEKAALMRVTPDQLRILLSPHISEAALHSAQLLASGEAASPGVGIGTVVGDADEAERRIQVGEAVVLARPTTSPEDLHGMIASRAVVTEKGGSTSHAAVVGRALGLPCVVGCGTGALESLIGKTVTVDGRSGKIYAGALAIETPDESSHAALGVLAEWAAKSSPLRVLSPSSPEACAAVDLSTNDDANDPEKIGAVLANLTGARGVRGGVIASDQGVRAALKAGLEFIVAEPVLPSLLAAVREATLTVPTTGTEGT